MLADITNNQDISFALALVGFILAVIVAFISRPALTMVALSIAAAVTALALVLIWWP